MNEGIVARGKQTVVRWFQREDAKRRQRWPRHTDPLYSHNDPRPLSGFERDLWFLEHTSNPTYRAFAVDDRQGKLIGWITLRQLHEQKGTGVLGIALDPTRMDRGLGTDALMAFLEYYFDEMGFREMKLDVAAFNRRAMRCYEKCGFRYEGQHWAEHPTSAFPAVFTNPRYANVVQYFRQSLLGVEVLYYDMAVDRAAYLKARIGIQDPGTSADRPDRMAAWRTALR